MMDNTVNTPMTDALYQPRDDSYVSVAMEEAYRHARTLEAACEGMAAELERVMPMVAHYHESADNCKLCDQVKGAVAALASYRAMKEAAK